ncbi:MAG: cyanophycinase [Actinomycetota bacterium]
MNRTRRILPAALLSLMTLSLLPGVAPPAGAVEAHGDGYWSWLRGNRADVSPATQGGAMLEGGHSDRKPAWEWFLDHAGYGDIVIICATCTEVYDSYVMNTADVDSVQTLKLTKRRATSDPFVVESVANAEGIFFAGGDQSDYVRVWRNSPVSDAVQSVIDRGGVVGGISAGLAIVGGYVFSAEKNTITSDKALADCFDMKITLRNDILAVPGLEATVTDSHFTERGRLGRSLVFMARAITDGWTTTAKGLGIDESTAVQLEADGSASVIGQGTASFSRMTADDVLTCEPATPLSTGPVDVSVVPSGGSFDVADWTGDPADHHVVQVTDGVISWES